MAAVPFPLMVWFHREKICCALIFDSLRKSEKHSVIKVPHPRAVRWTRGKSKIPIHNGRKVSHFFAAFLVWLPNRVSTTWKGSSPLRHILMCTSALFGYKMLLGYSMDQEWDQAVLQNIIITKIIIILKHGYHTTRIKILYIKKSRHGECNSEPNYNNNNYYCYLLSKV